MANSKALATLASTHIHDTIYLLKHCFFSFSYVLCLVLDCIIIVKSAKINKSEIWNLMRNDTDAINLLDLLRTKIIIYLGNEILIDRKSVV